MDTGLTSAVFFNGRFYTLGPGKKLAQALAAYGGRIVAVGTEREVRGAAPRGHDRIDLRGRTVIPAFCDSHTHFIQMGLDSMCVDLTSTDSVDEALSLLRKAATSRPEGEWIIGSGWKESGWVKGRFLIRADLDKCCPKHPVVAHRVCGHMSSVNSRAIALLGIDRKTPDVDIDGNGRLTGILKEGAVTIARKATKPAKGDRAKGLELATKKAHSHGVTSIHDNGETADLTTYIEAEKRQKLRVRVYFNTPTDNLDGTIKTGMLTGMGSGLLRFGGVKVFCDGALGARTAAISAAYADDPGNKGMFVRDRRAFEEVVSKANDAGLQLAIHAIGDRGIQAALDALRRALESSPREDHRHRVEHLELPSKEHLRTMSEKGIIASMQPNFVGEWGGTEGMYVSRLGPDRTARNNPFREVLDAGVRLVFGSDCMPFSPVYGILSAVEAPYRAQRISSLEAIRAYTRDASFASFEERAKGTLTPGKVADLAVLSADPFTNPETVAGLRVLKTVFAGKLVFEEKERRS
ncbi:MAG: amidohydrolase [Thermoplasmata archaeon]|nr:amidohydrolase [Thermoplasmata archaeon]